MVAVEENVTFHVRRAPRDGERCSALVIGSNPECWTGNGWVLIRREPGHAWFYAGDYATEPQRTAWGPWSGFYSWNFHVFPTRADAERVAAWYALGGTLHEDAR